MQRLQSRFCDLDSEFGQDTPHTPHERASERSNCKDDASARLTPFAPPGLRGPAHIVRRASEVSIDPSLVDTRPTRRAWTDDEGCHCESLEWRDRALIGALVAVVIGAYAWAFGVWPFA